MRARRILTAALLAGLTLAPRCAVRRSEPSAHESLAAEAPAVFFPTPVPPAAKDEFRETVRPILSARCGNCHDPGGRMYARLPFDDGDVVASHSAGVLRRLKGDDRAAVEKWLAGLAPETAPR